MTAPQSILDLVDRFDYNRDNYRNPQYNETQLRREFLDPFFTALGWDVENKEGYAEAYKDVVHEDAIKIGGVNKAPDYSFRIGGTRKFFVEAKKPAVNLKDDPKPAFQLRRYAWSAKLPLSILSDFEEFAVYDCRVQPDEHDKPGIARTLYIPYTEYAERWHEIEAVFSRNAILKGAFDKYAVDNKTRRGTAEVDAAFLKEIETWRESLAKNIALRNPDLRNRDLNFAVQIIIDRIIFLRICEDRGIDVYGKLQALLNGKDIYQRLLLLFREADERYNSGLFHFRMEKGRDEAGLDTLTPRLSVDDKTLKDILATLYYPCPYEFSVLPADILGQVYEQFLGKVIRLDAKHRAVVEDKPEVKKAGGVYYTPTYIVSYIVEQTVGKLLEGKTPRQVEKLRILDPACGSGSFLIGAYQRLLDWHQQWYETDGAAKHAKGKDARLYQGAGNAWHLTTSERKRILLANLYGVDIDAQAVEVTKLSLLLKMLEGETQQTVNATLSMFHERVLPDLDGNIQCGNSLIGPDFYDGRQLTLLDEEEMYRVNVFDWKKAFPTILTGDNPGFDAVIGNPPYIPIETITEEDRLYFQSHHKQLERKYDTSIVFILAMLEKLNTDGRLGFISSLTWQTGENFRKLREHLFTKAGVETLVSLPFDVFKNAYVDTGTYILRRTPTQEYAIYRFPKKTQIANLQNLSYANVSCNLIMPPDYKIVLESNTQAILSRVSLSSTFTTLGALTSSTQGLAGNRFKRVSEESTNAYPFMSSGQAYRYTIQNVQVEYVDMSEFRTLRPFYEASAKILIRRVINRQDRLMAVYFDQRLVFKKDVNPFIVSSETNAMFLLAVINSKLISFFYMNTSYIATKDDFRQTTLAELRRLPIPIYIATEKKHIRISELAQIMLQLHKQIADAAPTTRTVLQRQIDLTDRQIDALVYELYGLTPEEIALVEGR